MNFEQRLSLLAVACVAYFTLPVSAAEKVHCKSFKSCSDCTGQSECYWCASTKKCSDYSWTKIVPSDCSSKKWYHGQCLLAGYVVIILVVSSVVVFLLFLGCCIYCCCCRRCNKCKKKRMDKEDAKLKRKREERQTILAQKQSDRKVKRDEIRKKYGLGSGYERIEDDPSI